MHKKSILYRSCVGRNNLQAAKRIHTTRLFYYIYCIIHMAAGMAFRKFIGENWLRLLVRAAYNFRLVIFVNVLTIGL